MLKFGGPGRRRESSSASTTSQWSSSTGLLPKAPHIRLNAPRVRIEHDDAVIAVAVGDEQLVGRRMHPDVRGAVHVLRVGVALALVAVADLHDELAVLRELQQLVVGDRLQRRAAPLVGQLLPPDPDEALVSMWMPCSRSGHS